MNNTKIRNFSFFDLIKIKSHDDFHSFMFDESIKRYINHRKPNHSSLGSILALCANYREAKFLIKYPFDKIDLTGIGTPDQQFQNLINSDKRLTYKEVNAEQTEIYSRSYDLVLVKEGLHHLARPILGFYEMLRITKSSVIIIEPADTFIGRILEKLGLTTIYEHNQINLGQDNGKLIRFRDNYVFRWTPKMYDELLRSYYLNSGYKIDISVGWLTSKWNANQNPMIRFLASFTGRLFGYFPYSRGNYMSTLIIAGDDIPMDPLKI